MAGEFAREAKDGEVKREPGILGDVQRQDVTTFLGELLFERSGNHIFDCRWFGAVRGNSGGRLFAFWRRRRKVAVRNLRRPVAGEHYDRANNWQFVSGYYVADRNSTRLNTSH